LRRDGTLGTERIIRAGGVIEAVAFVDPDPGIDEELDAAYRAKYRYSPSSIARITSPQARTPRAGIWPPTPSTRPAT
jgi:hypothetical protein